MVVLIGCVQQPAEQEKTLDGSLEDFSKRDNVQGLDSSTELIESEKSFEEFAEQEYVETFKDVNIDAIIVDCSKHEIVTQKDYCYANRAVEVVDEGICEKVSDVLIKRQCIRRVAVSKLDASVCRKLDIEGAVYNCISVIASDESVLDEKLCAQIPEANVWREKCLGLVEEEKRLALS